MASLLALSPLAQAATDFMSPGLTPKEVETRLKSDEAPLVVDLRKPAEFRIGHIPGAVNIPLAELEQHIDELRHDNGVLIYCINGSRTRQAEPILLGAGIENLYHLEGAFYAWIQGKHAVEKGGATKNGW
jgi:rhodanese-related sulfurtransferase